MAKPIHIMRWAPADYVNDPAVKLALAQRDFVSSTFYPLFLFHAFIQGGTLPAEPVALGAILGMRPADVRRALAFWTEQGKVQEDGGRLSHKRVSRDLEDERAFRSDQAALGKLSASRRLASGYPLPAGSTGRFNPPAPLPAPAPVPAPAPAPEPDGKLDPDHSLSGPQREEYTKAVWAKFVALRGSELPEMSTGEFAIVHEWAAEIPLRVVLGVLDGSPQLRAGKVRALVYFRDAVSEANERRRQALGAA